MGTGDRDVVVGVGYPYVFKGHLASGQVREKEGGMAVWDRHESGGANFTNSCNFSFNLH